MRLICVLLMLISGIYSSASAQYALSGLVTDALTGQALSNVVVYLPEFQLTTQTTDAGYFQFNDLHSGSFLVEFKASAYHNRIEEIELDATTHLSVQLQPAVKECHEVIVTGVSRNANAAISPLQVQTLQSAQFMRLTSSSLVEAVAVMPGVSTRSTGSAIAKPIIRGLGANRIITLTNGIRQEGQQWGEEHGIEIDEYAIDRVELIKGPGSLLYGSDGIAGVLHFLTPKALPAGAMQSKLLTNYQSNHHLIGTSLSTAGAKKQFQWQAQLSSKLAGDYRNAADGYVTNSGFRELNATLFLGLTKKWGFSQVHLSSFNQLVNLPEGERDSLGHFKYLDLNGIVRTADPLHFSGYAIGAPHQEIHHLKLVTNQSVIVKKGNWLLDLAFQSNQRKEISEVMAAQTPYLFFELNTFNTNLRFNFRKQNGWYHTLGFGGMYQINTNHGLKAMIPNHQLLDAGVYGITQKKWNQWNWIFGLRVDQRLYALPFLQKQVFGLSGSIGFSYLLTKYTALKGNLARGFRAPQVNELSANGRHEGAFRYELGNQDLKPEFSHQLDLTYSLNNEHLSLEFSPFLNVIQNYCFAAKLLNQWGGDSIVDPSDPAPAFQFQAGNALLYGAELYSDLHPHPLDWLHVETSFSFVNAIQFQQADSMRFLPFIPPSKLRTEWRAEKASIGAFSDAYFTVHYAYYFAQNRIYGAYQTETRTASYGLLGASVGASLTIGKKRTNVLFRLGIENALNTVYQAHLSRLKYAPVNPLTGQQGIYNMGRNVSLKLIFTR